MATESGGGESSEGTMVSGDGPGNTAGGNSTGAEGGVEISGNPEASVSIEDWLNYADKTYGFQIKYPSYFTGEVGDTAMAASPENRPLAVFYFQDSRSEVSTLAPPVLRLQIYEKPAEQTLENWLVERKFLKAEAGEFSEPFTIAGRAGIKVTTTTFMAPGWSVYVMGDRYVYQLVPLGAEGETMLQTFILID